MENINNSLNKNELDNKEEINFIDFFIIIIKHKKIIIWITSIITFLTIFVAFFILDPWFLSIGSVKSSQKTSGLASVLSSNIPDIGGLDELSGSGSSTRELASYEEIILSRRCLEEVIIKFNLMDLHKIKLMDDAIKFIREELIFVKRDNKSGIIKIGFLDKSPQRSKEISEFLISELNKINMELNVQNAKLNREFLEKRYNDVKADLAKAEDSLKVFQDKYSIAPDVQVKAVLQSDIQLEAEIKSEEIKLDLLKKILTSNQAEVKSQEDKVSLLKKQLEDMRYSTDTESKLRIKGTPDMVLNYYRLQRNVEIQTKILTYIVPLFEQAKIDEKKDMPSVLVLDNPNLPDKKEKPKRLTIILITFFVTLFVTSLSAILYATFIKGIISRLKLNDNKT
jgi:tyrosine-protein kinase Etk/Wzc